MNEKMISVSAGAASECVKVEGELSKVHKTLKTGLKIILIFKSFRLASR